MLLPIHHVAFTVSNITKTVDFYKYFNFKVIYNYQDSKVNIVHLANNNFIIELFEFNASAPVKLPKQDFNKDLAELGIKHLAFKTENIEQTYTQMLNNNISIVTPITQGRTNIRYFFIQDPEGNFIEIVEDNRNLHPL